jgi:hypothetical protein
LAGLALVTRFDTIDWCCAVECACNNAGSGRFPNTARTTEQIGMVHTPAGKRITECGGDMVLTDDLGKLLRSPLACSAQEIRR